MIHRVDAWRRKTATICALALRIAKSPHACRLMRKGWDLQSKYHWSCRCIGQSACRLPMLIALFAPFHCLDSFDHHHVYYQPSFYRPWILQAGKQCSPLQQDLSTSSNGPKSKSKVVGVGLKKEPRASSSSRCLRRYDSWKLRTRPTMRWTCTRCGLRIFLASGANLLIKYKMSQ